MAACPADAGVDVDAGADTATAADTGLVADVDPVDTEADTAGGADTVFPRPDTWRPPDTFEPADVRFDTSAPSTCVDDSDCAWCATPKAPSASPTCHCPACNAGVVLVTACEAKAEAWREVCDGRDADGALCPELECKPPGPVRCRDGRCGAVER